MEIDSMKKMALEKLRYYCKKELECVDGKDKEGISVDFWEGSKLALYDLCIDLKCAVEAHIIMREYDVELKRTIEYRLQETVLHEHSVYTHCLSCHQFGINMPDETKCGNCGSEDTVEYYPITRREVERIKKG